MYVSCQSYLIDLDSIIFAIHLIKVPQYQQRKVKYISFTDLEEVKRL